MSQRFELGEGTIVESMPQPVMLYRDASYRRIAEVALAGRVMDGGGRVLPGRTPRGERFAYHEFPE